MRTTSYEQYLFEEQLRIKPDDVNTSPSDNQIKTGKYKKAKVTIHGIKIAIENPKGSTRSGVDPDGTEWENTFTHHYGYIEGTKSSDGDGIDVFVGNNVESEKVWVINQLDVVTGKFDEVKIMLGFLNKRAAEKAYLDNYDDGWDHYQSLKSTDINGLKSWIKTGQTTKEF